MKRTFANIAYGNYHRNYYQTHRKEILEKAREKRRKLKIYGTIPLKYRRNNNSRSVMNHDLDYKGVSNEAFPENMKIIFEMLV